MSAEPSEWVVRFVPLIAPRGDVLDVACGQGRHTRLLLERGHRVTAVDRDLSGLRDVLGHPFLEAIETDLEGGSGFPLSGRLFSAVIVTNYLYRPLLPDLVGAVGPRGVLIYETFAQGNARFGRPHNPEFLLRPGELLDAVQDRLRVISYEDVVVDEPRRAALQRICARRAG